MVAFYNEINYYPFKLDGFNANVSVKGKKLHGQIKGGELIDRKTPCRREYVVEMYVEVCKAVRPKCNLEDSDLRGTLGNEVLRREMQSMRTRASISFDFETPVKIQAVVDILTNGLVLAVMVYISHDVHKKMHESFDGWSPG